MEYLSVNRCFLEDLLWDFAVLPRSPLDQIYHIVDPTLFQTELLLLVTAVHYGGSQIVSSFSFNDEIQNVVCVLGCFLEFLRLLRLLGLLLSVLILLIWVRIVNFSQIILVSILIVRICIVFHSQNPYEVTKRQRLQFSFNPRGLEPVEEVIDVLIISLLSIVHHQDNVDLIYIPDGRHLSHWPVLHFCRVFLSDLKIIVIPAILKDISHDAYVIGIFFYFGELSVLVADHFSVVHEIILAHTLHALSLDLANVLPKVLSLSLYETRFNSVSLFFTVLLDTPNLLSLVSKVQIFYQRHQMLVIHVDSNLIPRFVI